MKTSHFSILLFCFLLFTFFSCKKDNDKDTTKPTLSISTPDEGDHYSTGDTVFIEATAMDDTELHAVEVHLHNETASIHALEFDHTVNATSYYINLQYIIEETESTDFLLEFTLTDAEGNILLKSIDFTAN